MSTKIMRTCDKCNTDVPANEPLYSLAIVAKINAVIAAPFPSNFNWRSAQSTENIFDQNYYKDYCLVCLDKMGLLPVPASEKKKEPKVTIEDLLQEIVSDAVEDRFNEGP